MNPEAGESKHPLLGPLTWDRGAWVSKDRRWTFGRMEAEGLWQAWEGEERGDYPAFGQAFRTLRDAKDEVERTLQDEAAQSGSSEQVR